MKLWNAVEKTVGKVGLLPENNFIEKAFMNDKKNKCL
jgi:hypothetical protein